MEVDCGVTNTLDYYKIELINALKSFEATALGETTLDYRRQPVTTKTLSTSSSTTHTKRQLACPLLANLS